MFSFLKKLFGGSEKTASCCCGCHAESGDKVKDLENFVDYVVRQLVDYPDEVSVSTAAGDNGMVISIHCRKEDIGKVVGKRGKTVMAIRSLVSGAAGRMQQRISVEVVD